MSALGVARPRVGVAGWDYADWAGVVYPRHSGSRFDRLAWISRFVDVVEINSSFYRPVAPRTAESWARRTAERPEFLFTAKSHRSWTHEPDEDLAGAVDRTLRGLLPLREAGRLGALLVQFPQSFHQTGEALAHLERLLELAADWPLVFELRHASWGRDEALGWFAERDAGWCVVDQPRVGRSTLAPLPHAWGPVGYVRLHGRNTADWFRSDAGRDRRYDYRYSRPELEQLADLVTSLAPAVQELFVVQNNHFRGQALANALQLAHLLGRERPPAPQELVDHYPDLSECTTVERSRLF